MFFLFYSILGLLRIMGDSISNGSIKACVAMSFFLTITVMQTTLLAGKYLNFQMEYIFPSPWVLVGLFILIVITTIYRYTVSIEDEELNSRIRGLSRTRQMLYIALTLIYISTTIYVEVSLI